MIERMVQIGDFVDVASGPAFESARFTTNPADIPLVKGENIAQGYIAWEKSKFWPSADAAEYQRFALQAGDIVLAMDRPWIDAGLKWARIKPHDRSCLLVQRVARLRARRGLQQEYLTYVIGSSIFSEYIRNIMGGTNVPHISGGQIRAFEFPLPTLSEQAAIAGILSAYDDLIENNRRRIALLERAARLLYREWFVHLRFPGHQHTPIADGVPEGWDRRLLASFAITNGSSHAAKALPDPLNYIDIASVSRGEVTARTSMAASDAPGRARRKAMDGDIIWSNVRPNLRAYALILNPSEADVFSTGFTTLTATTVPFTWLYQFVTTEDFISHLINHATGAGYPAVRPADFERAVATVPTQALLQLFHEEAEPMFRLAATLRVQNQKLAQARDLLLPRLMSGEIAV